MREGLFTNKETTKKMSKKIRIANTEIEIGQKYTLDHKYDSNAPSAMKKLQATKYPFEGNDTIEKIWFNEARRQFDTGFYEASPCLNVIPKEERAELVKSYQKNIKTPYENTFNVSLDAGENNEFWEKFTIKAWVNKQFDTSKIDDLLELFYVLYMGVACEKDEKNPILNTDAQFVVTSPIKLKSKSKELSKLKLSTTTSFMVMADSDRDKLNLILQWLGKEDPSKVDAEDLKVVYYQIINNSKEGTDFCEKFKTATEEYETEKGKEKMEWFYSIRRLYNLRKIKKVSRGYVTADQELFLGNTLQDIASFCINDNTSQHQVIKDLIEENPNVRRAENSHIKEV